MFGNNPIRKPVKGDGTILEVQEIFPTFQGEGIYAGRPSIFIRLGGCNLACNFCDTEFESFRSWKVEDILKEAKRLCNTEHYKPLIVLTGGEPFRQPIGYLCDQLLAKGFHIQIETNGTLYRPIDPRVDIVCSPKAGTTGYQRIREDLLPHINALKFIVSKFDDKYKGIAEVGQSDYGIKVFVQPMDVGCDEKNAENVRYAGAMAVRENMHLSLQMHKIAEVP